MVTLHVLNAFRLTQTIQSGGGSVPTEASWQLVYVTLGVMSRDFDLTCWGLRLPYQFDGVREAQNHVKNVEEWRFSLTKD